MGQQDGLQCEGDQPSEKSRRLGIVRAEVIDENEGDAAVGDR